MPGSQEENSPNHTQMGALFSAMQFSSSPESQPISHTGIFSDMKASSFGYSTDSL